MIVYAIRHKPTQQFMPTRLNRSPGGWSHWSPGYVHPEYGEDKPHDPNPRLFFTPIAARNALAMWLQGTWKRDRGTAWNLEGPEDWDHVLVNPPPAPRRREDMEIVRFTLEELR